MATMRALSSILLSAIVWSCISLENVHGASKFLVTNTKCQTVEVPRETTIKIHYEAPDIDLDKDSMRYSPASITVMERPITTLEEQRHELQPKLKPKVVSQELTEVSGSFMHTILSQDSVVDVCVRATKASVKNPMFFHLRVEELEEDVLDEFEKEKAARNGVPLANAEHHWSFMETQLDRIEHEMHTIIKEADFFRERDALYHQQTDDLHKATLFWPILHCCILAVTGFTQANHIVSFFKKRRII